MIKELLLNSRGITHFPECQQQNLLTPSIFPLINCPQLVIPDGRILNQTWGLAGAGQTLNNCKDYFIANCLQMDDIHLGSKERVIFQSFPGHLTPYSRNVGSSHLLQTSHAVFPARRAGSRRDAQPASAMLCLEFQILATPGFSWLCPSQPAGAGEDSLCQCPRPASPLTHSSSRQPLEWCWGHKPLSGLFVLPSLL